MAAIHWQSYRQQEKQDLSDNVDVQDGTTETKAAETPIVRNHNGRLIREGEPEETPLEALASICTVIVIALFAPKVLHIHLFRWWRCLAVIRGVRNGRCWWPLLLS